MISISLCMIVKNEEKIIARCLDSVKDLMDEIIIIDTGSTDSTKEIAARYTDKIYDYEWTHDFAAARNFSFSKATMDYIYTADADEVIDPENFERFMQLKECLLPEIEIVQMKYVNSPEFNTVYNFQKEYRPKLFKRIRTFNWISPVHETINLDPVVFDSDIEILHLPQADHKQRDFSTFVRAVRSGTPIRRYLLYMFCKELFISGTDEDFINNADVFTDILSKESRSEEERRNINCVLARIHRLKGNTHEFFKICLKDVAVEPCAEICIELGEYFYSVGDYEEAILWFINASTETKSIISIHSSGDLPLFRLADCYSKLAELTDKSEEADLFEIYSSNAQAYRADAENWIMPVEI